MIRQVADEGEVLSVPGLTCYYGRKIRSLVQAYGVRYDFCRFYRVGEANGVAAVFNSGMTLCADAETNLHEIDDFIRLNGLLSVEMPADLGERLSPEGYAKISRVLFDFVPGEFSESMRVTENPPLDRVFQVLRTGFSLEDAYGAWLTDASHRVRHGVSRVFLYESTTATLLHCLDGFAFFGQVATSPESRGRGHARALLFWLENRMTRLGIRAQLFARRERASFYTGIGFREAGRDFIFEKELQE